MNNHAYRTLGRSGLVVSPLALGTMTFGRAEWGASEDEACAILDAYVEAGGTFIDAADVYADGVSEEILGRAIEKRALRDRLVVATKFSLQDGDPEHVYFGGNGRKNMLRALEGSLRRLRTDYIDVYWMHVWDRITPVEEMLQSFNDLVQSGKIRYFALSDVPAWYAAQAATLAAARGMHAPIALQLEYSLVERNIEREHIPAAAALGLGICPWSPLASGFLSGKYRRTADGFAGTGRLDGSQGAVNPLFSRFTDKNWAVLDVVREIAAELDRTPAQIALAWLLSNPGITAPVIGARTTAQLHEIMQSAGIELSTEQKTRLDTIGAPELIHPYSFFTEARHRKFFAGAAIRPL